MDLDAPAKLQNDLAIEPVHAATWLPALRETRGATNGGCPCICCDLSGSGALKRMWGNKKLAFPKGDPVRTRVGSEQVEARFTQ